MHPFYGEHAKNYADIIGAPREDNYSLTPFGEGFFPAPTVTYSKVMVKSLERKRNDGTNDRTITKHATGKVVSEFYTTKDFPTKVRYTGLTKFNDRPDNSIFKVISSMLFTHNKHHLTMSQGFSIVTNDMNGRMKMKSVFPEGKDTPITWSKTNYTATNGTIDNKVITIDEDGAVAKRELGVNYDVINDFRENYTENYTAGLNLNFALAFFGLAPTVSFLSLPTYNYHQNILRTAVTTKVINKMGLPLSSTVYNDGAKVTTENVAWDARTGSVLVTKTKNEYDDAYYSMNFPAYWANDYSGMGMASQNIGLEGKFVQKDLNQGSSSSFELEGYTGGDLTKLFHLGDELWVKEGTTGIKDRYWVVSFSTDKKTMTLMDRFGSVLSGCAGAATYGEFKIVRSGYRNLHTGNMAAVSSMVNPIKKDPNDATKYLSITDKTFEYIAGNAVNPRIVNVSAVTYNDFWPSQRDGTFVSVPPEGGIGVNPFVKNIRGNWRAVRSYAYLTGRSSTGSTRREGYLTDFKPFYEFKEGTWKMRADALTNWTFASEISQFTPHGAEIENKDALGRYSSAQFGQKYGVAQAVASNSEYREMGFAGFEHDEGSYTHFNFGGSRSSEEAHTGNKSLKVGKAIVNGATTAVSNTMTWNLKDCAAPESSGCPTKYPCTETPTPTGSVTHPNGSGVNADALGIREFTLKGGAHQRVCYGFAV